MRFRWAVVLLLCPLAACLDLAGPRSFAAFLTIVPVFGAAAPFADNADQLRVIISRDSAGTLIRVKDTVLAIDPDSGTARASFAVVLLQSPTMFRVRLEAVRSADAMVLFSGEQEVAVAAGTSGPGGTGTSVQIPVNYTGPKGVRVVISPKDTAVTGAGGITFRAAVLDATNAPVAVPVAFRLVDSATAAAKASLNRLTGVCTVVAGATGEFRVFAYTPDNLRDTARVLLGAVPAATRVEPGYAAVAAGATVQLTGTVLDAAGNPLATGVTWTSRTPGAATVNASGLVTGVATGSAVIVASASGFSDSARVLVPAAGNVLVSTTSGQRAFRSARVGDTVVVDLGADLRFTTGEKLGSYNARLNWASATLQFIDVQSVAGFAAPTVNPDSAAVGLLRLGAADANGASGQLVVARVRFRALAQGTTSPAITITELSGTSPTFTNFFSANRVTVTSGSVTVRP